MESPSSSSTSGDSFSDYPDVPVALINRMQNQGRDNESMTKL